MFTKSGIYTIKHQWTGIVYVGRSKDIFRRWGHHYNDLMKGIHHCKELQSAWDEHLEHEFIFEVYKHCPPHKLIDEERWSIQNFESQDDVRLFNTGRGDDYRPGARLLEDQVREIKTRLQNGEGVKLLASVYNVCESTIRCIKNGRTWADISV